VNAVLGDVDGRENLHALCDVEFPGAHLCHLAEYGLATSTTAPPATGAWIDSSCTEAISSISALVCPSENASTDAGRSVAANSQINCLGWTVAATAIQTGIVIRPQGTAFALCNVPRPVACCLTPYLETFRGLTAASYAGNVGGRHVMHATCAAEYPGSHLCHSAEYERAASTVPLPATGAWADSSTFNHYPEYNGAMPRSGRLILNDGNYNCENWTSASNIRYGVTVVTPGPVTVPCNVPRPLACCGG
jgi:hypothetical protein